MSTVKIPPVLRSSTGGEKEVEADGSTVGEVLQAVAERHSATESQLFSEDGELNRYVNVYLNDEDVRVLDGLDTPVRPEDTLVILPAMAGGAPSARIPRDFGPRDVFSNVIRMRRIAVITTSLIAGLAGALALAGPASAAATPELERRVPGSGSLPRAQDVLVRFRAGADGAERAAARREAGTRFEESLPVQGLQKVDPEPGVSVQEAVRELERSPDVLYAEPNQPRTVGATPNDDFFEVQWGLHNTGQQIPDFRGVPQTGTPDADVDAPEAWNVVTGAAAMTVAVADSGIDYDHPDLSPNVWTNPGESGSRATDRVDNDGNGFVDDFRGWDFVQSDNNAQDENGHGTHVSGTIGASGNDGVGVAGVAWDVGLMPVRVLDAEGSGFSDDFIEAAQYARAKGARVVNASLGGPVGSDAERDAIAAMSEVLFVFAAGNEGLDNDTAPSYPCNYPAPNVICVAATDNRDQLADFSNYGDQTVDLAAPGVSIASTWHEEDTRWVYSDGTSMAAPHVAGAAALAWSASPSTSVAGVRAAILGGVDPKPALQGTTVTGGRLNLNGMLGRLGQAAGGGGGTTSGGSSPSPTASSPSGASPSGTSTPAAPSRSPAPAAAADRSPPTLTVRVASRQALRTLLRSGVRARAGCSEQCTVRADLLLSGRDVRRLRLRSVARSLVLARGRATLSRAGTITLRLRLSASANRRLRRASRLSFTLRTRASDPAGNSRTVSKRLVARR